MLAVQIPLVQYADFYKTLSKLTSCDKWKKLSQFQNFHILDPNQTYDILSMAFKNITMWETVYYHVLPSHDAVIDWYKGSGLRPYLEMLNETEKTEFLKELSKMLKTVFPIQKDSSVILKMPRLFFIAEK